MLKRLLDQWNTFTAGGSTKLTPDQYHRIQDGVHISKENLNALKLSKLVGDITNTRSSSGPLVGTLEIKSHTASGAENPIVFQPDAGSVYLLGPASLDPNGTGSYRAIPTLTDGSATIELADLSGTGAAEVPVTMEWPSPVYVDNSTYLKCNFVTVDTDLTFKIQVLRVR
jgi:hypothetical protein